MDKPQIPDVIYLQVPDDGDLPDFDEGITWCRDQIEDWDVVYRRVGADEKSVFGVLRKMYERLRDRDAESRKLLMQVMWAAGECSEPIPEPLAGRIGEIIKMMEPTQVRSPLVPAMEQRP